jgi:ubiquinone/menaquinone biosynthesis C-methylase UbiE
VLTRRRCVLLAALALAGAFSVLEAQRSNDRNRDEWQKVPEIFAAMRISDGSVVADVGAGSGFFTTRLARQVGLGGRVYAVDVDAKNVDRLRRLAGDDGLMQVTVVHGTTMDPGLPDGALDAGLVVNAYHEFTAHQAMLAAILRALKPGGRLVIVEPLAASRRDDSRERQERSHEIGPQFVREDLTQAGFEIADLVDPFTKRPEGDEMWLVVARKQVGSGRQVSRSAGRGFRRWPSA